MLKSVFVLGFLATGTSVTPGTVDAAHQLTEQPLRVSTVAAGSGCATAPVVWLPGALQIGDERQSNELNGADDPQNRASSSPDCALV